MKTKKKVARKPQLLELFLKVLAELYPFDRLSPGVCLAWLPKEKCYYGSVLRYESEQQKQVLISCKCHTLQEVMHKLVSDWRMGNRESMKFKKQTRRLGTFVGPEDFA